MIRNKWVSLGETAKWVIALSLTVFVIIALNMFWGSSFESNDDTGIMKTLSGYSLGKPAYIHNYASIVLGSVLSGLYTLFAGISWYTIYTLLILIICYTVIFKVLLSRLDGAGFGRIVLFLILAVSILMIYPVLNISYTVNAGLCGTASVLLLLDITKVQDRQKVLLVCSTVFLSLCMLIRFSSFKAVLPIWIVSYVYSLCQETETEKPKLKIKPGYLVFLIAVIAILIGYYNIEADYKKKNELASYQDYELYRGIFSDTPCITYDGNPEFYESIGWDKELYTMAKQWYYLDERFNKDTLKAIVEKTKMETDIYGKFKDAVKLMFSMLRSNGLCMAIMLLISAVAVYQLIYTLKKKNNYLKVLFILGLLALFCGELFYLCWRGRFILRAFL